MTSQESLTTTPAADCAQATVASRRKELAKALMPLARPDTRTGLLYFLSDFGLFALGMALALAPVSWPVQLLGSLLAGLKLSALYTLGHDVGHNTLTASARLNKVLGLLLHTPLLFNSRLWHIDHNGDHHRATNGPQADAYRPMSWAEYQAAPAWRRGWERFVRSLNPLSLAPYYMYVTRVQLAKTLPLRSLHDARVRRQAWPYVAAIAGYLAGLLGWMYWRHEGQMAAFGLDVALGLVLPLMLAQSLIGFALYVQHTHPDIPWFAPGDPAQLRYGQEEISVSVRMPRWLGRMTHDSLVHTPHHVLPALPCYRLHEAQLVLDEHAAGRLVNLPASWAALKDVVARCKLYDYERRQWVDFQGRPTSAAHSARG